jgi:hypothetical protein
VYALYTPQAETTGRRTKCKYQSVILHCAFQLWRTAGIDEGFHETCSIRHAAEREKIAITWFNDVISGVYGLTARELAALRWWILNSSITQRILQYILGKVTGKLRENSVLMPDDYLQYYCAITRHLFTILLCQNPETTYNITVPVPGNYNITVPVPGKYLQH